MYRFRKARDLETIRYAHTVIFADTAPMPDLYEGAWWLVYDGAVIAGFCGVTPCVEIPGAAYLCRAGVMPAHRGRGLQLRMIRVRESWARKNGFPRVVTETTDNVPSANNLIRAGYTLFNPPEPWSYKRAIYFTKSLALPSPGLPSPGRQLQQPPRPECSALQQLKA